MQPETPVITPDEQEQLLFQEIDEIVKTQSLSSMKLGWAMMRLWNLKMEEFMEYAKGHERRAMTEFTDFIVDREQHRIESRSIISERFRIARFVSPATYEHIVARSGGYQPSFHQLRACVFVVKDEHGNEVLDKDKFNLMVKWCIDNAAQTEAGNMEWPTVRDIREQRDALAPEKVKLEPHVKRWQLLYSLAQKVAADSAGDGINPNTARLNAAKAVMDAWMAEATSTAAPQQAW